MGAEEGPRLISPMKNEEYAQDQARCSSGVIPLQFFAEIGDGENREHRQCNHFLNAFELRGIEFVGADAICRHHLNWQKSLSKDLRCGTSSGRTTRRS